MTSTRKMHVTINPKLSKYALTYVLIWLHYTLKHIRIVHTCSPQDKHAKYT